MDGQLTAHGRLVILNGTSSAGKTTLATAFRDERAAAGEYWLLLGIDDVLSKLPVEWLDLGLAAGCGAQSADGLRFESTVDGPRLRVGAVARSIIEAYHRWVADAVRAGVNVIVDDVVLDRATLDHWCEVLDGLAPIWVAVRCAPEIVTARESARGDRPVGMASTQHDVVHHDISYAVEVDT
ncbi:MAG: chloramphenicol phosphotransferase, partial [Actinomycetota bacterium]